jgi:methionine-rich copper-binding protein CopC
MASIPLSSSPRSGCNPRFHRQRCLRRDIRRRVGAASACAFLAHADPPVGSTVHGSPAQLKLWFSEEVESAFSSIRVLDASGKQVDKDDRAVNPSDKTLLTVSVPRLLPGKYKVVWQVVSVDTHKTEGNFTFTVAP